MLHVVVVIVVFVFEPHLTQSHTIHGISPRPKLLAGQQDKEMTPSSRGVLKTISENAGTPGVVVGKMHENADTPAVVVDNMHENAGTQALFADMAHDDVTLDHEGTVKGQEDKLEEVVASLNTCFGSDSKKVLVVVKKEELQHRENSVEAFLANFTEVQEGGKEVDIELIFLLEEKQEKFSRKIVKLERSLKARQQLLDHVSMQLMVCSQFFMPWCSSIAESQETHHLFSCMPSHRMTIPIQSTRLWTRIRRISMQIPPRAKRTSRKNSLPV
jgi:hypothetical protein